MEKTDFNTLIPELPRWNNGRGIAIEQWINCVGNFEHAIGYSRIFWPEFVEHDGCVFSLSPLNLDFQRNYGAFLKQARGDKKSVEAVMNHQHILHMFADRKLKPTREQIIFLGRTLKEIWGCKLKVNFPDKNIIVSFPEGDYEDYIHYEITFFQEWPEPISSS